MKLFHSGGSPFARKCLVVAHELGLAERIERVPAIANPVNRDRSIVARNPLGKLPTLIADDDTALYDSRVICEYLNDLGGGSMLPRTGSARFSVLVEQALGDGMLDAAVLVRYEAAIRPEPLRWADWTTGQLEKIACGLAEFERRMPGFDDRVDLGTITFACVLGYLDFRFDTYVWRDQHPNSAAWFEWFGGRDSMVATRPQP